MRQIIISVLALAVIAGGIYGARTLIAQRKPYQPKPRKIVTSVFTETVQNSNTDIKIRTSGQLVARDQMTLFSEVQGVFEATGKPFKPGVVYRKGDLLIKINSDEFYATLQAQKSQLYNQVIALMPDLRLDYPESFPQWDAYVKSFDLHKPVPPLPEPVNDREKLFISGRNLYATYYNVISQERRLDKYNIYAPYTGVLTSALVQPGTLVRQGQQLGEFIDQGVYELEAAVNVAYLDLLKVGESVTLRNIERTREYNGKVVRINGSVDQSSQTITAFIQVSSPELKAGMYLEAELDARQAEDTYELSRKLLLDGDQVFVVRDTVLATQSVEPVYFKERTVVVRGLEDGTELLAQTLPGAYPGMSVQVVEQPKSLGQTNGN